MAALDRINRIIQWYKDYDTSHEYEDFDLDVELEKLRDEIAAEREKHRWIPVTERLPEEWKNVFVWCVGMIEPEIGHYSEKGKAFFIEGSDNNDTCFYKIEVTHWMPLPEPQEED